MTLIAESGRAPVATIPVYVNISFKVGLLALVLFAFKGSLLWAAGWLYVWLFGAWCFANTYLLLTRNPGLLLKRILYAPDPAPGPDRFFARTNPLLAGCMLAVCAYYPAWPQGWLWWCLRAAAFAGLAAAYLLATWALLSNTFALKAVLIQPGQAPVRAGPYAYLRHPIYSAFLLFCACTPAVLGSFYGYLPAFAAAAGVAAHTRFEDGFLLEKLEGYREYAAAVRWTLVPWLW